MILFIWPQGLHPCRNDELPFLLHFADWILRELWGLRVWVSQILAPTFSILACCWRLSIYCRFRGIILSRLPSPAILFYCLDLHHIFWSNYDMSVFSRLGSLVDLGATFSQSYREHLPSSVHHFGELSSSSAFLTCYPGNDNDFC